MYFQDYIVFLLALLACMAFSMLAGAKVKSAYAAYSRVPSRSGLSGHDTAERLLRMNGVNDISLGRVSGELSDHYNPAQSIVNLSTGTYEGRKNGALLCVVPRMEASRLKKIVSECDAHAFVTVCDVHEALGEGFSYRHIS